ncbi:MAG: hypothetical protein AAGC60_16415 [Acidobacteriota bacterium]
MTTIRDTPDHDHHRGRAASPNVRARLAAIARTTREPARPVRKPARPVHKPAGTRVPAHQGSRTPRPRPETRPQNRPQNRPQTKPVRVEPEDVLEIAPWLDRDTLPATLPRRSERAGSVHKSVTVILAGDLTLGDATYRFAARQIARHVILVADRLRLAGTTVFDLSGRALDARRRLGMDLLDRSGGDLVIAARDLVVEDGGRLVLRSAGGRGPHQVNIRDHRKDGVRPGTPGPRHGGGHGGDLVLAARRVTVGDRPVDATRSDESIRETLDGLVVLDAPPGGAGPGLPTGEPGRLLLPPSFEAAVAELEERTLRRYGFAFGMPPVSRWARRATSEWLLASLERAIARLRLAALGGDPREGVSALSHAVGLARDGAPLREQDRTAFGEHLDDLTALADRFDDALAVETITVQAPSGLPRRLQVLTAGDDLTPRLAPTELLLRTRHADGRALLGLLALDAAHPEIVRLELEAQLTLDPWLAHRAGAPEQPFDDWTLVARPLVADGIVTSRMDVGPSGLVRVVLELDAARAGLVLARLASSAGLPLIFDWRSTRDREISGVWQGPALSLTRRLARPVTATPDGLQRRPSGTDSTDGSADDARLSVAYVALANGGFVALDPAPTLEPGASVPLPAAITDLGEFEDTVPPDVPAEALVWSTDVDRPGQIFQVPRGDDLVTTVTIENLLSHDAVLGGLLFVEVELVHGDTTVGPYRLAPARAVGDRVEVSLLAVDGDARRLRVRGAAHYEGGSRESFDFVSDDLVVKITDQRLRSGL